MCSRTKESEINLYYLFIYLLNVCMEIGFVFNNMAIIFLVICRYLMISSLMFFCFRKKKLFEIYIVDIIINVDMSKSLLVGRMRIIRKLFIC